MSNSERHREETFSPGGLTTGRSATFDTTPGPPTPGDDEIDDQEDPGPTFFPFNDTLHSIAQPFSCPKMFIDISEDLPSVDQMSRLNSWFDLYSVSFGLGDSASVSILFTPTV